MVSESSPNIKFLFSVWEIFILKRDFGDVKPEERMEGDKVCAGASTGGRE
jgi:hypothetical protein